MKQYNYIYKITNLANGKIYIGKHSTNKLCDSYMGSGKILCKAKAKYGKDSFKKEIIAFSDNEDSLNFLEKFYIKKYKSQDSSIGYNITDGGEGTTGFHQSEASRKKISAANKGKFHSDETRAKMSASRKGRISPMKGKTPWNKGKKISGMSGKHHSDETIAKMSASRKGIKLSDVTRAKMRGRHPSEETRAKISDSLKGKPSWNKGKKMSDEYCKKMSIAHKGKCKLKIKYKWMTLDGEIKIMGKGNANRWHPDWKLIEE